MSQPVQVAVVGAHHTPIRGEVMDQSLEEMIFEAARGALADAGLTINDIDGVILTTADQVEGRVIESMVTNGAAGGVGRDVTTLASAGEHGLVYAYVRLRAEQGKRLLVLAWSKPSESTDPSHAGRVAAEPFLLRPLGLDATVAAGLQASAYTERYRVETDAIDSLREQRYASASRAHGPITSEPRLPSTWPLNAADSPRPVDVACAVVVCVADVVTDEQSPAWISGVGWSTGRYDLGERDLTRFEALSDAAARAGFSGIDWDDIVEIDEVSTVGAFAAYESLGLCAPGEGASLVAPSNPMSSRINPSGGSLPVGAGNAAGFLRLLSAAQQVRGRAGSVQVEPSPNRAVGATLHGFAGQGATVVTFTAERALA